MQIRARDIVSRRERERDKKERNRREVRLRIWQHAGGDAKAGETASGVNPICATSVEGVTAFHSLALLGCIMQK